jgi:hypothetical protein
VTGSSHWLHLATFLKDEAEFWLRSGRLFLAHLDRYCAAAECPKLRCSDRSSCRGHAWSDHRVKFRFGGVDKGTKPKTNVWQNIWGLIVVDNLPTFRAMSVVETC